MKAAAVLFGILGRQIFRPPGIDVLEAMVTMEPMAGGAGAGM